jgi:hypothetical protein
VGLLADRSDGWSVGLLADRSDGWSVGLTAAFLLANLRPISSDEVSLSSANDGLTGLVEGWSVGFSADRSDGLVVPCFALFCILSFSLFPPRFPLDA